MSRLDDKYMFKAGDIVCFRAQFLRGVGFYTDVPTNGKVIEVSTPTIEYGGLHRVKVEWCDDPNLPAWVHNKNLILYERRRFDV